MNANLASRVEGDNRIQVSLNMQGEGEKGEGPILFEHAANILSLNSCRNVCCNQQA